MSSSIPSSSMQAASINSNIRSVGHMFSTPSEQPDNVHFSSSSEIHSMTFPQESDVMSWGTDPFEDILQFPDNVPTQNDHVEYNGSEVLGGNAKTTDFKEWVDQLMSVDDDSIQPNWNELLGDDNMAEPKSQVCFLKLILILYYKVSKCLLLSVNFTRICGCHWHLVPLYG